MTTTSTGVRAAAGDLWLRTYASVPEPSAQVYAFAHSGGGPSTFRRWQALTDRLELRAVALAGRERRIQEPPARDVLDVVDPVSEVVAERASADRPVVLLGVSLGALLAHLVAHRLAAFGVSVRLLVTVSATPPHLPPPPPVHDLPDDALVDWMLSLGGLDPAILEHPELLRILMPAIRADLELSTHQVDRSAERLLDVSVLSVFGRDDTVCTAADVARWAELTRRDAHLLAVPGGHFLDDAAVRRVLEEIDHRVGPSAGGCNDETGPHPTLERTPR